MAGTGEVTLGSSRHLPAHGIARRASSRKDGASQAEEKRLIWAFLVSQARRGLLHERSLAREGGQGTKHEQAASREPGFPLCGQPNTPLLTHLSSEEQNFSKHYTTLGLAIQARSRPSTFSKLKINVYNSHLFKLSQSSLNFSYKIHLYYTSICYCCWLF